MKLAIVYDRVNKWGGAERVLLALHTIWPDAPLYTAVYDAKRATWANVFHVHHSFLGNLPHEMLPWITPMAFESFDFRKFDVVLSVTSAEAKDVITQPGTAHICYCLTPTRYLWHDRREHETQGFRGAMLRLWAPLLKRWDSIGAARPDRFIAISQHVAKRIKKYYNRDATVIYPPVDTHMFTPGKQADYFICVSRLVPYKKVDRVIQAFNTLGEKLVIVGTGSQEAYLRRIAKSNITFAGHLTDHELAAYYQRSRAFVFAGEEDFGIVALEAQSCGIPVVCPRDSGMAETVIEGKTGELFDNDIMEALHKILKKKYDSRLCRMNAEKYSVARFQREMKEVIERYIL